MTNEATPGPWEVIGTDPAEGGDLSYDPPSPWHYGTTQFKGVSGSKLRLEKPQEGAAS